MRMIVIQLKKLYLILGLNKYANPEVECPVLEAQINRLKEFQNNTSFKKAILSYLSTRVTDEDIKKEKELFETIDK